MIYRTFVWSTEKLTKKRRLISRFDGNERKFVIKKRHRVEFEKKSRQCVIGQFSLRKAARRIRNINELKKSIVPLKDKRESLLAILRTEVIWFETCLELLE